MPILQKTKNRKIIFVKKISLSEDLKKEKFSLLLYGLLKIIYNLYNLTLNA